MTDAVMPRKGGFHALRTERGLTRALRRPRAVALAVVLVLSGLGWIFAALMAAAAVEGQGAQALGPGMGVLDILARPPADFAAWARALCAAPFSASANAGAAAFGLLAAMWAAMALAMMLPTAAPMLLTYAELSETAARQGEPAASPLVLAAGYLTVWVGFALGVAALQFALLSTGLIADVAAPVGRGLALAIFLAAGLYQFSALKHACLKACQHPFRFFFANWTESARGVFRLGLRQGAFCLGCCWAAMLVMFAVGTMNVVWMAGLGVAMTVEKMLPGKVFSRVLGAAFLAAAVAAAFV